MLITEEDALLTDNAKEVNLLSWEQIFRRKTQIERLISLEQDLRKAYIAILNHLHNSCRGNPTPTPRGCPIPRRAGTHRHRPYISA